MPSVNYTFTEDTCYYSSHGQIPDTLLLEMQVRKIKNLHIVKYRPFGPLFNHLVDNLPEGLEYLKICSFDFDQPLDYLPSTLKKLEIISMRFNQKLDNLPNQLEELMILSDLYRQDNFNLPHSLKKATINYQYILEKNKYLAKK